jgi:hypothetical protein
MNGIEKLANVTWPLRDPHRGRPQRSAASGQAGFCRERSSGASRAYCKNQLANLAPAARPVRRQKRRPRRWGVGGVASDLASGDFAGVRRRRRASLYTPRKGVYSKIDYLQPDIRAERQYQTPHRGCAFLTGQDRLLEIQSGEPLRTELRRSGSRLTPSLWS